jgi:PAS domain S-box-containing protein
MNDKTRDQLTAENEELRRRVTAMESVEAELRRSEAKWRSVVANTPVFVCLVDRAGAIQYLNRTVPGIAMEDAIGRSTYDFLDPAHWEIARECIERVFDTGQTAFYESVSAGPNGSRSWYETNAGPVTVGDQVVAVTLIATDITQRKHAETALLESEERFKTFMDNSPALAWMKDDQGRHVYINKPHEKRFGLRLEDREGKTDFELWPLETAEQFWKNDQAVLAGNTAMEVVEEITAPDGGRTYWWNFKFPFQDASGKRYVGGVGIDITERKRAEEALQKAHGELEQKVQERTAELAIFKKFAEASGLGFGMTDLDGRIAYVNSAWLRLVGESQVENVTGKHISTYCPKEYCERRDTEVVPAVLQKGLWQGEFSLVSRDGRRIPAIHSLFPIRLHFRRSSSNRRAHGSIIRRG